MKKNYLILKKQLTFKLSLMFVLLGFFTSSAQVTTNSGSGLASTYPDLASAITALNGAVISSPVVITLSGNETAPLGGYSITAQGDATNTIIIEGSSSTITAPTPQASGLLYDAIFKLVGADWVTIQSFTMLENDANTTTAAATNNMTEWGVALLYASTTNGAQNNTIRNNTIDLNRTYQNTFGIYSNSTHSATVVATSATATTNGGNSGLKIYSNTITDINIGIVVVGPSGAADHNDGVDIGGISSATGNSITNYGTTGTFSSFSNVSGTVNGILIRNTKNYNVSYNTITSSNGGVTSGTVRGVFVPAFTNAPVGTVANTISNNNISVKSGLIAGAILGIAIESTTSNATTSLDVSTNDFNNFGHTVAGTAAITFISNASPCLVTNINSNTFTNNTVNTTGSVTFITNSVTRPANAICNVNNNAIVTGFSKTSGGGTVVFYSSNSATPSSGTEVNNGNNFSNLTFTGATTISGWQSTDGSGTSPFGPSKTVSNNTFSNIIGGTSSVTLLNAGYGNSASTNLVSNNIVSNITSSGSIVGITSSAANQRFENNTINGLSTTGASTVNGMTISGGSTQTVSKNKIYNLESNNAGGSVNGILVSSGTSVEIQNNVIGDLRTPIANAANPLNGINVTGGTTVNLYHNTVYLNASSSGALFGSSAIAASSTPTVTLRNNIFVNNSTPTGTGLSAAYRRGSATLTSYGAASNNNIFYASTIFSDGTNTDATLTAYKTRVNPRDTASQTEDTSVLFQSTTGSNVNYLRIPLGTTTFAESGATLISTPLIDTDYWNVTRPFPSPVNGGTTPDIGASEFDGLPNLPSCVTPADQATLLVLGTTTATTTAGSFTAAASSPTGYLVVASTGPLTVTPTDGTNYITGATLGNGIVLQSNSAVTYSGTGLIGNTNYTISIFSYNTGSCIGGPKYLTLNPLTGTITTCPVASTALVNSAITNSGFTSSWTAPTGGSAGTINYTMDVATDAAFTSLVGGSPISVGTATTQTVSGLLSSTTYYIRIKANNGVCDSSFLSATTNTLCTPATYTTTDGTRCGVGSVALTGTTSSGDLAWYAVATGGVPLFTGTTFNTPVITTTTPYYVESQIIGTAVSGARLAPASTSNTATSNYGLVFDAISSFKLNSVDVYNGTTTAGTFVIQLQDNTGAILQTSTTFTAPAGTGVLATNLPYTANLGWNIPAGSGFRLLVSSGSASLVRELSLGGFPYALGAVGNITSGYIAGTSSTYYYLYNWNVQPICISSPRTLVTATVTPAPTLTTSGNVAICNETSTVLTVSSTNDPNYSYTWSPATGLSSTTGSTVTASPTTTTTYTVTANDGTSGCIATATIVVTVNQTPTTLAVTPATGTICQGTIQQLSATGGTISGSVLSGSGTNTSATNSTSVTLGPNPLQNYYGGTKQQWIYTAAELSTLGFSAGSQINAIKLDLATANTTYALANLVIKMKNTPTASFASVTAWETGLTTVRNAASYTPVLGINSFALTTPFVWDGTNNLVIEMNYSNNNGGGSPYNTAKHTPTSFVSTIFYRVDNQTSTTVDAFVGNASFVISSRNDVTFDFTAVAPITWSPITDLYTDSGATVPYTGTSTGTVYAKPNTTVTYTATATLGSCTKTASSVITVNPNTSNSTTVAACDTYTWAVNGTTYTTSGTYTSVTGCNTETLVLTITPSTSNSTTVAACDTYTWAVNGTTYTTSGTYTSVTGCNTETLVLTITPSTSNSTTVATCDTYTWAVNGTTYTTSGTYTSVTGCNTETLVLTITPSTSNSTTVTACDTYTWAVNGTTYTTSGTYTSVTGCNTETLVLTITPSTSNSTTVTACDTYTWAVNGTTYTTSGTYTSVTGCNTETLVLTITPSTSNSTTVAACDTYTWAVNGTTYTTSGTYTSVTGCNTETLVLTITPSTSNSTTVTACDTYTWAVNGTTYTTSGTYTSVTGCNTETLVLTITPSTSNSTTVTACGTYTWSVNGATYTTSGTYTSVTGCNTETLVLTINTLPNDTVTQTVNTLTATQAGATYQWVLCDGSFTPISGATSQSYEVTAIGSYAVQITVNGCTVTSACVNVTTLSNLVFNQNALSFYPNPVVSNLNLKYDTEITMVRIYDLGGRLIRQFTPNQTEVQVDMSGLASALYIVKINANELQTEIKIIKQ